MPEILLAILIIILIIVIPNVKIVPQAKSYVIERLGSYYTTWQNGLHFKIPFIDRVSGIIQPAGSIKDKEVIAAADKYDISMITTGIRHLKH